MINVPHSNYTFINFIVKYGIPCVPKLANFTIQSVGKIIELRCRINLFLTPTSILKSGNEKSIIKAMGDDTIQTILSTLFELKPTIMVLFQDLASSRARGKHIGNYK